MPKIGDEKDVLFKKIRSDNVLVDITSDCSRLLQN